MTSLCCIDRNRLSRISYCKGVVYSRSSIQSFFASVKPHISFSCCLSPPAQFYSQVVFLICPLWRTTLLRPKSHRTIRLGLSKSPHDQPDVDIGILCDPAQFPTLKQQEIAPKIRLLSLFQLCRTYAHQIPWPFIRLPLSKPKHPNPNLTTSFHTLITPLTPSATLRSTKKPTRCHPRSHFITRPPLSNPGQPNLGELVSDSKNTIQIKRVPYKTSIGQETIVLGLWKQISSTYSSVVEKPAQILHFWLWHLRCLKDRPP